VTGAVMAGRSPINPGHELAEHGKRQMAWRLPLFHFGIFMERVPAMVLRCSIVSSAVKRHVDETHYAAMSCFLVCLVSLYLQ